MKKKNLLIGLCAICALGGLTSLVSCGGGSSEEPPIIDGGGDGGDKEEEKSIIKSLTAKKEVNEIKIGEVHSADEFYTLLPVKGTLTAKQKKVSIEWDNKEALAISGKSIKALAPGESNVTVTSEVDKTKTCTFKIIVKGVFFNRETSGVISEADDFSKELIEDGATVTTSSSTSLNIFANVEDSTTLYTETKIKYNSTDESEHFPKFGIVFSTFSNPVADEDVANNEVYVFLNAERGNDNAKTEFNQFGVCEVYNSGGWAWNPGITNAQARHCDAAHVSEKTFTVGSEFKLAAARIGSEFHVWLDDTYVFSFNTLDRLFKTSDGKDTLGGVGFFEFNSNITFSGYSVSNKEEEVKAKVNTIETKKFIGQEGMPNWAED